MLISSARPRLVVLPARIFTSAPRPHSLRKVASVDSVMIADWPTARVPRLSSGTVPGVSLSSSNDQPARLTGAAPRFVISMYSPDELTGLYIHSVILTFGESAAKAAVGSTTARAAAVAVAARAATVREICSLIDRKLATQPVRR